MCIQVIFLVVHDRPRMSVIPPTIRWTPLDAQKLGHQPKHHKAVASELNSSSTQFSLCWCKSPLKNYQVMIACCRRWLCASWCRQNLIPHESSASSMPWTLSIVALLLSRKISVLDGGIGQKRKRLMHAWGYNTSVLCRTLNESGTSVLRRTTACNIDHNIQGTTEDRGSRECISHFDATVWSLQLWCTLNGPPFSVVEGVINAAKRSRSGSCRDTVCWRPDTVEFDSLNGDWRRNSRNRVVELQPGTPSLEQPPVRNLR